MIVFHHDDLDGQAAARLVYEAYDRDIKHVPINYEKNFPFDKVDIMEKVFIVDYSIEPEEMLQLLEITEDVVWIDHHKTAIEKYKDFPHEVYGVREIGVAGCELTHRYLKGKGFNFNLNEEMNYVKLIGDYDVWKFDFGEVTKYFHYGLLSVDTSVESEIWDELKHNIFLQKYIDTGKSILEYQKQENKEYIERFAFERTFEDYNTLVCNQGNQNSLLFGDNVDFYDICAAYCYNGEGYIVSLYSKNVDVSQIAAKHGGGGHKGAAGFISKTFPF